jgi:hypothetical protein
VRRRVGLGAFPSSTPAAAPHALRGDEHVNRSAIGNPELRRTAIAPCAAGRSSPPRAGLLIEEPSGQVGPVM